MVARLGSMRLPRSRILRRVFAAVGAGVLLAMLGPFGTYLNHGPVARVGYWIAAMLLGFVLYGGAFAAAGLVAPLGHRWRGLVLVGAALLASIPETAITRALAFRLWPELAALGLSWPLWFAQASLLGLMAVAIAERMRRCGAVPPGGGASDVNRRGTPRSGPPERPARPSDGGPLRPGPHRPGIRPHPDAPRPCHGRR